jgi:hypothetical protein
MEDPKFPTVGAAAVALQAKASNNNHSIIDQTNEQIKEYCANLIECVNSNKSKYQGDFYIVVITKKERLLENVLRNYFFARNSCPTPDYDQALFKYNAHLEEISFIWVVPDKETCVMLIKNMAQVVPEERELLQFAIDFASGKLMYLAKKMNGENE